MSDQSAATQQEKEPTSKTPTGNGKPSWLSKAQIALALSIDKSIIKKLRREKKLPLHVNEDFIRDLQKDPPKWLADRQQRRQAQDEKQRQNLEKQKLKQQREQERQRLHAPQAAAVVARELAITISNARNLIVLEQGKVGVAHIRRERLDLLKQLESEALEHKLADAKKLAPRLRQEERQRKEAARIEREAEKKLRARQRARAEKQAKHLRELREEYGVEEVRGDQSRVRVAAASTLLKISENQVRAQIDKGTLSAELESYRSPYGRSERYMLELESLIKTLKASPEWLEKAQERGKKARKAKAEKLKIAQKTKAEKLKAKREAEKKAAQEFADKKLWLQAAMHIQVPERKQAPEQVVIHTGPTNSGKTYQALQHLIQQGQGVYAAPLRFLAGEAYDRLSAQLGENKVGLVTGEEKINPQADIICCTAEMAPLQGQLLALDEAHWAADRDRGAAWTRLICAGEYRYIHIMSAPDALPLLTQAFPQAEIQSYQRKSPLTYQGSLHLAKLTQGTAVVCFSRKAVLALAGKLRDAGVPVATLYGALPPQTRREELDRFASGEAKVLCTTDVIGHGVNVPSLRTIAFAETEKFDGQKRRNLEPWEIAQIAGRAGRYGLAEKGEVVTLQGLGWFSAQGQRIAQALEPRCEVGHGLKGHRSISKGVLRPRLDDLGCEKLEDLPLALQVWIEVASYKLKSPWLKIDPCHTQKKWLALLAKREAHKDLSLQDGWKLAHAPLDPEAQTPLFLAMEQCLRKQERVSLIDQYFNQEKVSSLGLEDAEERAKKVTALRWFVGAFHTPYSPQQASDVEVLLAQRISQCLRKEIKQGRMGRCKSCNSDCAPWFTYCEGCFTPGYNHWDDDW